VTTPAPVSVVLIQAARQRSRKNAANPQRPAFDLGKTPPKLADTIRTLACNAAHLAGLLKQHPYPAP
jgi:hypothetical protein